MSRFFAAIAITLTIQSLHAQKLHEKQLLGSWELMSVEEADEVYLLTGQPTVLSFYKRHIFQKHDYLTCPRPVRPPCTDTLTLLGGNWELSANDSMVRFTDRHTIPDRRNATIQLAAGKYEPAAITWPDDSFKVLVLSDSLLTLLDSNVVYCFKRTETWQQTGDKPFPFKYVIIPDEPADTSRRCLYYLVNSADTSNCIEIEEQEGISLAADSILTDSATIVHTFMAGRITDISDSAITCNSIQVNIFRYSDGVTVCGTSASYTECRESHTVSMNTLQWARYSSHYRRSNNITFILLTSFSAFEMLFVAPLVSINYKNGTFNSQRYFRWAGAGLIGISVGIPMLILTKEKKYLLTTRGTLHDKNYWYLEKR